MKVYDGQGETESEIKSEQIKVGIAEYDVTKNGAVLTTSGLGSCIGVALYDDTAPVSGLVHVMLPSADDMEDGNSAKFADTGVETLIEELEATGGDRENMVAKIAGGSDMLDFSESGSGIGQRNVEQVKETLEAYDIPIVGEDVGGNHGRSIKLKSSTGDLVVKSANKESTVL
ncbi:chemotaxis protein CheD [Halapricum hydrolyticum]|uniref:Probable chemoreceptor glutamine deamidase CheD n=1 Tax=Halapricum hydrolyticum TaxID=2979991 RepID=A0AAE3I9P4_9EURY|nr:chemotaxis protein CheD [Halapricum hydrolyticum]MCU4717145.1 chemotaxis protein CheD [Halapricum hydrolyticum]MCU4726072.1 chemotaxis protein CheD [Halapricum hydrolyticum]